MRLNHAVCSKTFLLRWVLGLGVFACIIGTIGLLLTKGVKHVQQNAARMQFESNLKYLGHSMLSYEMGNAGLPSSAVLSRDGKPLLSWRVLLLNYIEQHQLYKEFRLDEPWDSEHNRKLIPRMPRCYTPFGDLPSPPGTSFFQVISGPGTLFEQPRLRLSDLGRPLSEMFLIVEAAEPVIWTKPDDIEYDPARPPPRLGGVMRDGFFRAVMADGGVRMFSLDDENAIRFGITGEQP